MGAVKKENKAKIIASRLMVEPTPAMVIIENHYERLGVFTVWDAERYYRLASFMNLTLAELGQLVGVEPAVMKSYLLKDCFPRTVSLLLSLLEYTFTKSGMVDSPPYLKEGLFPTHKISRI
jgi:hypothetical protein